MNAIEIRDTSTNRADRYQAEANIAGTSYSLGIASRADAIAGTSPGALVSAQTLAAAMSEPMGATFVVNAAAGNVITTNIQLTDGTGTALAVRASLFAYLSDDANGDSVAATAPDGGWAAGTDGVLIPLVAGKAAQLVSEADGDIDVAVTESGTDTFYIVLVLPSGKLKASGALAFT